jgi:NADH:ubiquinone oxidoreductase subunit 5 (subunit L)/multisubunit Na+/H+ antiporter MnhA subunit
MTMVQIPWKSVGGVLICLFIIVIVIGILCTVYFLHGNDAEEFRRNVEFWIGHNGLIFAIVIIFIIIIVMLMFQVIMAKFKHWEQYLKPKIGTFEKQFTDTITEVQKSQKSLRLLTEEIRISTIPELKQLFGKQTKNILGKALVTGQNLLKTISSN